MSSLTGGLSPDLGGAGPVKRTLEDAGDSGQRTEAGSKKYKQDLANLPTRQYLDQTVVPILLQVKRQLAIRGDLINLRIYTCGYLDNTLYLFNLIRVWQV